MRVLYPGSFDPVHNGHVDIVERSAALFDHVVVAAMRNPGKGSPMFSFDERIEMLDECFAHLPNVSTVAFSELVVDLARTENIDFIVKGLRGTADFESELQMAQTNRTVSGVETLMLPTSSPHGYIASKYIREIASFGGDVESMIPAPVAKRLVGRNSS